MKTASTSQHNNAVELRVNQSLICNIHSTNQAKMLLKELNGMEIGQFSVGPSTSVGAGATPPSDTVHPVFGGRAL